MKDGRVRALSAELRCRYLLSNETILAQLRKRVELNDPDAMCNMALHIGFGHLGLPVDEAKCIDLLREAAGLGHPDAQAQLGTFYDNGIMGLEKNEEEALKYWEKAAKSGDILARHNHGCTERDNGDYDTALRHFRLSAAGGYRKSMEGVIECFEKGLLHHKDLAETLQPCIVLERK